MLVTGSAAVHRLLRSRITAGLAAAALFVPSPGRAIDPVSGLNASRVGDDLVITWLAAPPPVDGYRVYRSRDAGCASLELVYDGPLTSWSDAGALADPAPALYGVAAYDAAGESARVGPVYKYAVELPVPLPGSTGGRMVAMPATTGPADSQALCADLNGEDPPRNGDTVQLVIRSMPDMAVVQAQACRAPIRVFPLGRPDAYVMKNAALEPTRATIWGVAALPETLTLSHPWFVSQGPDLCDGGQLWLSLPWDHAYADLAEIAAEIPQALRVQLLNPDNTGPDCNANFTGLSRASTADPWSGDNLPLAGRRGEGVMIAVETAPVEWTPRRQCTAFQPGGAAAANLPPVADAGGPYDSTLCRGGVIGIWLDGEASFDPDASGPLGYQWTTTCSGTITEPTAALTSALFDCNPCEALACSVSLRVIDALGAADVDVEPVFSRQSQMCLGVGNQLFLTRTPAGVLLDWSQAAPAQNYVTVRDVGKAIGSPEQMACGPAMTLDVRDGAALLELFKVDGMNEACAGR